MNSDHRLGLELIFKEINSMQKKVVPIYQIPDFDSSSVDPNEFYYSRLDKHLQKHKFIQNPHKHDFYIVLLFTEGTGTHTIDFQTHAVDPGTLFFLVPGQVHSWDLSKDANGYILFFSSAFYTSVFTVERFNKFSFFHSNLSTPIAHLQKDELIEFTSYFKKINSEVNHPQLETHHLLKNYIDILLTLALRAYLIQYPVLLKQKATYSSFKKLEHLISNHFTLHREASFYAEGMNMSLKQLNTVTKKAVGKTVSQLIFDRIILEAKRLLVHSDISISEISFRLKFDDPSYFSRLFKKKTSFPPEEFRLKNQHMNADHSHN